MKLVTRRALLSGLGVSAGLVPLLDLGKGHAAPGDKPARLIVMAIPNGDSEHYLPVGGETGWTAQSFEFSPLKPLEPFRDKILVLGGVAAQNGIDTGRQLRNAPVLGHAILPFLLTGARGVPGPAIPDNWELSSAHASVDQYVAQHMPGAAQVPYQSLVLRTLACEGYGDQPLSYSGPCLDGRTHNAPSIRTDPRALFDELFGAGLSTSELERIRAEKKSMLDFTFGQLTTIQQKVGTENKRRIQEHLDGIVALEKQLSASVDGCTLPPPLGAGKNYVSPFDNINLPAALRAQMDITVSAMACDLTRVATILCSSSNNNTITYRFLADRDAMFDGEWNESENGGSGNNLFNHHTIAHNERMLLRLKHILDQWYFEQYAYLLQKLSTTLDPDGTPMLDSTIVLFCNMQATGGGHQTDNLFWVLGGNCNGYFRSGRYLRWASGKADVQAPTNGILTAIVNAMGCPRIEYFGEPDYGGELKTLLA
jgi:hypothetical protein